MHQAMAKHYAELYNKALRRSDFGTDWQGHVQVRPFYCALLMAGASSKRIQNIFRMRSTSFCSWAV